MTDTAQPPARSGGEAEIERDARHLCLADGYDPNNKDNYLGRELWTNYTLQAQRLHAAGLTVVEREPSEERLDAILVEILSSEFDYSREAAKIWIEDMSETSPDVMADKRSMARAAYRAMVAPEGSDHEG